MKTEKVNHGFENLLEAIDHAKLRGYSVEFLAYPEGLFNPKNEKIYLPKNISKVEIVRIYAPLSEPDEESILYLLEMNDLSKGWISDTYGIYSDTNLSKLIKEVGR